MYSSICDQETAIYSITRQNVSLQLNVLLVYFYHGKIFKKETTYVKQLSRSKMGAYSN